MNSQARDFLITHIYLVHNGSYITYSTKNRFGQLSNRDKLRYQLYLLFARLSFHLEFQSKNPFHRSITHHPLWGSDSVISTVFTEKRVLLIDYTSQRDLYLLNFVFIRCATHSGNFLENIVQVGAIRIFRRHRKMNRIFESTAEFFNFCTFNLEYEFEQIQISKCISEVTLA